MLADTHKLENGISVIVNQAVAHADDVRKRNRGESGARLGDQARGFARHEKRRITASCVLESFGKASCISPATEDWIVSTGL